MPYTKDQLAAMLRDDDYPRSNRYDPEWALTHKMGPNVLWITEALGNVMDLKPGMRVLDMGCGRALSSIFLAREYDVQVWATDLWISPTENWQRIRDAGLQDRVFPVHADAHDLPYSWDFFDAIVSLDAYHYFGTNPYFLTHGQFGLGGFLNYLKPGRQIGIVVPGVIAEPVEGIPDHLVDEFAVNGFHSAEWWRRHWETTRAVDVELADFLPRGWELWVKFDWVDEQKYVADHGLDRPRGLAGEHILVDGRDHLGFTRVVARRRT